MNDARSSLDRLRLSFRLRQLVCVLLICSIGLLTYFATRFAKVSLEDPLHSPWVFCPFFFLSLCVSFGSIWWILQQGRRIWTTGRLFQTGTERIIKREKCIGKLGSDRPFWPQAPFWLVVCGLSLALLSIVILALAFAVSLDRSDDLVQILLFLLASALLFHLLILPLSALQRKVASGNFLPSGGACAALCERYWKPQEIERACITILTASIWSCSPIIKRLVMHRGGSGSDVDPLMLWVLSSIWWVAALRWLRRVFYPVALQPSQTKGFEGPPLPEERTS